MGLTISARKKTPIRIHRRQYPLTPAYAFTDQKAQCQTLEPVIVDIGQVPGNFGISPFAVYVALSRGRGRESIRLLRDFEDSLLTRYPSEAPRVEDDRLNMLRRITKEKNGTQDFIVELCEEVSVKIARKINHLPITKLELVTLAFTALKLRYVCTLVDKLLDVEHPMLVYIDRATAGRW